MRPGFLVIGAAKAGTTSLCQLLSQHPALFLSTPKELHWFSFDEVHAHGADWYESHFDAAAADQLAGEGSTTYTVRRLFPRVAERVARYRPDMKLIYVVREPLARIESVWLQLRHFLTASPFQRVGVRELPAGMRVSTSFDESLKTCADCLIESTDYGAELAEFRGRFPPAQIHVILFERLFADPRVELRRCFEFLGVDARFEPAELAVHLNETSTRRMPRDGLWKLWSSPLRRRAYDRVVGLLPQRVRDSFRGLLTMPIEQRPEWTEEARAAVRARLDGPLAEFLAQHGYSRDAWAARNGQ